MYQLAQSKNSEDRAKAKDGLHIWIQLNLHVYIPTKKVCENHIAPFDFVADTFFGYYTDIIALANRNGGKTINFAVIDLLNSLAHDKCETATIGAIQDQAIKCYSYFQNFLTSTELFIPYYQQTLMSKTEFSNDSMVQILTGTIKGVNSPHPHKAFLDEVDLMDWSVLQEAFSMARSSDGITGQNIITSTRKYLTGPMSKLLDEAPKLGFRVYEWCIREVIRPHNKQKCKDSVYDEDCQQRCDKSDGFYDFGDVLSKKKKLDPEVWKSQWLCEKPEKTGLMYPQFQAISYPNGNLRSWDYASTRPLFIFEDYGYGEGHPDVVLFVQPDIETMELQIFDEIYVTNMVAKEVVLKVVEKLKEHDIFVKQDEANPDKWLFGEYINGWIPDPSGLTEAADRASFGCPMLPKQENSELYLIANGAAFLRKLFYERKLLIDPRCVNLVSEYNSYRKQRLPNGDYKDKPEKKNDHGPDATRYGAVNLFPIEALGSFGIELEENQQQSLAPLTSGLLGKVF